MSERQSLFVGIGGLKDRVILRCLYVSLLLKNVVLSSSGYLFLSFTTDDKFFALFVGVPGIPKFIWI